MLKARAHCDEELLQFTPGKQVYNSGGAWTELTRLFVVYHYRVDALEENLEAASALE